MQPRICSAPPSHAGFLSRIPVAHCLLCADIGIVIFRKPGLYADDHDISEQISAFQPFLALFF
jgi:hypothetical protein